MVMSLGHGSQNLAEYPVKDPYLPAIRPEKWRLIVPEFAVAPFF